MRGTLAKHNKETLAAEKLSVDVKSAIWLAGFPRRNKAIISPAGLLDELRKGHYEDVFRDAHERAYGARASVKSNEGQTPRIELDFIGPGIDIGFHLCSQLPFRR